MILNKLFFSIVITLMPLLSTASAATVYKWVDEDGQVHYGHKAKNDNAKEVEIKNRYIGSGNVAPPADSDEEEPIEKQKRYLKALDSENNSIAEEKRKKIEKEERRVSRCNASRDQLKRAEGAGALYDLDKKGNRVLLNKKQYEIAMGQARARVEKWCN